MEGEAYIMRHIGEELLDRFETADINGDSRLSYEEAVAVIEISREQFNVIDINDDALLCIEEIGGEECSGHCCRTCDPKKDMKHYVGDWLLIGLSMLILVGLKYSSNIELS